MAAPLKPWERTGVNNQHGADSIIDQMSGSLPETGIPSSGIPAMATHTPPPLPPRPIQQYSSYGLGSGTLGYNSPYGGYGGYGGYSSLSSYGGYNSPYGVGMYGGYGGYGSGYGLNRFGQNNEYGPNSFVRMAEDSSRQAFQSIESIVQAFGSVAMMMESTFYAVYNSFRAVIGVADHFSQVRNHFAQLLSAFAVIRTIRWLFRKLLVLLRLRPGGLEEDAWAQVVGGNMAAVASGDPKHPKSNWPILFFFAVVIGGPYLIWKFLSKLSGNQAGIQWADGSGDHFVAQAEYDFAGEGTDEISFRKGQKIIIAPKELQPRMRGWLLASVNGQKKGIIPANYVKILGRRRGKRNSETQLQSQEDKTLVKQMHSATSAKPDHKAWSTGTGVPSTSRNMGHINSSPQSNSNVINNNMDSDEMLKDFDLSAFNKSGNSVMNRTASDILSSMGGKLSDKDTAKDLNEEW